MRASSSTAADARDPCPSGLAREFDEDPKQIGDTSTGDGVLAWAAFGGHPQVARLLAARGAERGSGGRPAADG